MALGADILNLLVSFSQKSRSIVVKYQVYLFILFCLLEIEIVLNSYLPDGKVGFNSFVMYSREHCGFYCSMVYFHFSVCQMVKSIEEHINLTPATVPLTHRHLLIRILLSLRDCVIYELRCHKLLLTDGAFAKFHTRRFVFKIPSAVLHVEWKKLFEMYRTILSYGSIG